MFFHTNLKWTVFDEILSFDNNFINYTNRLERITDRIIINVYSH